MCCSIPLEVLVAFPHLVAFLWNSTLRTKRTSLFQRLFKSSSKIIRDLIKLQSVPAVAKFYHSGTSTIMSSYIKGKSMGKGSIVISVKKLPRPLMEWRSTWSELICCTPENLVGSSLLVLTQNVWWWNVRNSVCLSIINRELDQFCFIFVRICFTGYQAPISLANFVLLISNYVYTSFVS